jgi:hypothetical protein
MNRKNFFIYFINNLCKFRYNLKKKRLDILKKKKFHLNCLFIKKNFFKFKLNGLEGGKFIL